MNLKRRSLNNFLGGLLEREELIREGVLIEDLQ